MILDETLEKHPFPLFLVFEATIRNDKFSKKFNTGDFLTTDYLRCKDERHPQCDTTHSLLQHRNKCI